MNTEKKWIIGTVITIAGLLITLGFFNSAAIVLIVYSESDSTCPNNVYNLFDVAFVNHGKENTNLCVSAWSDKINFTKNSRCLYMSATNDLGISTTFKLTVDTNSLPQYGTSKYREGENISIYYNWQYKKNFFQSENETLECKYKRNANSDRLILIP